MVALKLTMIRNRYKGYLYTGLCAANGLKCSHKLTLLQGVDIHSTILEEQGFIYNSRLTIQAAKLSYQRS